MNWSWYFLEVACSVLSLIVMFLMSHSFLLSWTTFLCEIHYQNDSVSSLEVVEGWKVFQHFDNKTHLEY